MGHRARLLPFFGGRSTSTCAAGGVGAGRLHQRARGGGV